jgi:hypothetical protein
MGLIGFMIKAIFVFALFTAVGQIRVDGRSLENRYHVWVNSQTFQKHFWNVVRPATWTYERALNLIQKDPVTQAR